MALSSYLVILVYERKTLLKWFIFCLIIYETIFKYVLVPHKKNEDIISLSHHLPLHLP